LIALHRVLLIRALVTGLLCLLGTLPAVADGERFYLSGTGLGDTEMWDFSISSGRRSGSWATIEVPSQWELEGFGSYAYGFHDDKPHEVGSYRRSFMLPAEWSGQRVRLVFEGVMTDTAVRLNGVDLEPVHRGGFTEFSYWVTDRLRFGEENSIEIEVAEHSAERTVNEAERDADYWVFGGIYRPVYLEALPAVAVEHLAVDAQQEGQLVVRAEIAGATEVGAALTLKVDVQTLDGEVVWREQRTFDSPLEVVEVEGQVESPLEWSAEFPNLYRLEVRLVVGGETQHTVSRRIGFRTVELRADGVWVNGKRVLLKGINRHSFWPDSGRTLDREINRRDAELIKAMNANAVRTSHYPPDRAFLDACDEIGLYVLEELPGWHDAYSTSAGRPLVRELVRRDVHRPSIILWANGNEGGWNRALDADFTDHDLQRRPVLHPDELSDGLDTTHYLSWEELDSALDPEHWKNRWRSLWGPLPAILPTEILHGLYDGGHAAGLVEYWDALVSSPRGAGLFLWAFLDESVRRVDLDGEVDGHGSYAPDGIVGPYRQPEGSYWAAREIWSPVGVDRVPASEDAEGAGAIELRLENRYVRTDLSEVALTAIWTRLPSAEVQSSDDGSDLERIAEHRLDLTLAPGEVASIEVPRPAGVTDADLFSVLVVDRAGREILQRDFSPALTGVPLEDPAGGVAFSSEGDIAQLKSENGAELSIDLETGALVDWRDRGAVLRWLPNVDDGVRQEVDSALMNLLEPSTLPVRTDLFHSADWTEFQFVTPAEESQWSWTLYPSGWVRLRYRLDPAAGFEGVRLPLDLGALDAVRWLGRGPDRVWGNRQLGGQLDVWEGSPEATGYGLGTLDLTGIWADLRWLEWSTDQGTLTVIAESFASGDVGLGLEADRGPFVTFLPMVPVEDPRFTLPEVPAGLSFLHSIPSVGTKFHRPEELAPTVDPKPAGLDQAVLWLRWQAHPEAIEVEIGAP